MTYKHKYDLENPDHYEYGINCPYCDHLTFFVYANLTDDKDEDEIDCQKCNETFFVQVEINPLYYTYKRIDK